MKFAAIDIGSNAVRLLFSNVSSQNNQTVFKKESLIRIPIRLGEDAFIRKKISREKADQLIKALSAFKNLIEVVQPEAWRACATSAMREAKNGDELVERIRREANMDVEIIDGRTEASIINSNHIEDSLNSSQDYLYIDVGGGSTELTLIRKGKFIASRSFNVGTIRMLKDTLDKKDWSGMKEWVRDKVKPGNDTIAIGSGGNINKLYKLSGNKNGKPLSIEKIKEMTVLLSKMSYDQRVADLGLNPDRADVIIPAGKIFHAIMKTGDIRRIMVPQIGLADGIIHLLYEEWLQGRVS